MPRAPPPYYVSYFRAIQLGAENVASAIEKFSSVWWASREARRQLSTHTRATPRRLSRRPQSPSPVRRMRRNLLALFAEGSILEKVECVESVVGETWDPPWEDCNEW
eukprot:m.65549 g.65549  ORF g.65549 m.65549 type:complete len:107 (+) comp9768_c0_seq1:273-593(+)